jgi:hypothetical protein
MLFPAANHPALPIMTHHHSPPCQLARLLLASLLLAALPAAAKLTVMHGYADYTSALVWVMADAPGPIEITGVRIEAKSANSRWTRVPRRATSSSPADGTLPGKERCIASPAMATAARHALQHNPTGPNRGST